MEAPLSEAPAVDPFGLLKALENGREATPALSPVGRLYTPGEYRIITTRAAAVKQAKDITNKRVGDLLLVGYAPEYGSPVKFAAMCACGEHLEIHMRSAQRALLGERGEAAYYAPVGVSRHFPAPEPSTNRWPCPHIEKKLAHAYPKHYTAWVSMKKQVQTRVSMYPATLHKMRIEMPWFDKATGFAQFVIDVGLPDGDEVLRKRDNAGGFTKFDYEWSDDHRHASARAKYPELARRFYALRSHARKEQRYFQWHDFTEFVRLIHLPEDFTEDPSKWRLRWDSAAIKGYTVNNYRWERLHKGPVEANESWNQIAQVEEIRQQFPFEELGLSPAQYNEALITFGGLIYDCNRVGDDLGDLLTEAINTVKGENYES